MAVLGPIAARVVEPVARAVTSVRRERVTPALTHRTPDGQQRREPRAERVGELPVGLYAHRVEGRGEEAAGRHREGHVEHVVVGETHVTEGLHVRRP